MTRTPCALLANDHQDGFRACLAELQPQTIWIARADGYVEFFNQHVSNYTGVPFEQLIGSGWGNVIHPDDLPPMLNCIERAVKTGESFESEFRMRRADGTYRWHLARSLRFEYKNGQVMKWVGFAAEIEDQKQAAEDYRRLAQERDEALTLLRLQIHKNPIGHIVTDAHGRITDWNPAAERIFGYLRDEMLGHEAARLFPRGFAVACSDAGVSCENVTKAGAKITCEWFNTPLQKPDGSPNGMLCQVIDVTANQRLEAQFVQAQKMEAIGHLAGGVAHDFNNLLCVINGYSEILLKDMPPNSPVRNLIEQIHKAGERSASLTRQLLAFSRKSVVTMQLFNPNDIVADLEKMLRRLIGEDINLGTSLCSNLGYVKADPGQIEQVLLNLAVNARDAMPQGGKLTVETHNVELDEGYARMHSGVLPGRYVLLAVSDTGCGMTPEVKRRIFEPFFTTKGVGKGTGLGLATVFGIVKQAEGHIEVYSEPGVGTSFKIYLPRADGVKRAALSETSVVAGGNETVLLVEDDEAVRGYTAQVLRSFGYNVVEACNGADAMRLYASHPRIDLLLTDVVMPGLSGRELSERLLTVTPTLRVLYLSGYTDDAVVRHGILQSAVNFLQKPCSPRVLASKVREVLDAPGI